MKKNNGGAYRRRLHMRFKRVYCRRCSKKHGDGYEVWASGRRFLGRGHCPSAAWRAAYYRTRYMGVFL